jgi:hypothetical protein
MRCCQWVVGGGHFMEKSEDEDRIYRYIYIWGMRIKTKMERIGEDGWGFISFPVRACDL